MTALPTSPLTGRNGVSRSSHWSHLAFPCLLIMIAWSVLLWAFSTNHALFFDHDYLLLASHLPWLTALLVFLLCWPLMTIAMMLPSTISVLSRFAVNFQQGRWRHTRLVIAQSSFVIAYIMVWMIFAVLAFSCDTLVHWLVKHWWWLYTHAWLVGSVTFVIAGVFQLSSFKRDCLSRCWATADLCPHTAQQSLKEMWRQGLRYGLFCLGSCWAVMLLMFGLGLKNLLGMVALTAVIFVEKEIPGGARLRPLIGVSFLLLAGLWFCASWLI